MAEVKFNVLAKDVDNALELFEAAGNRVLIGIMVKEFPTEAEAINSVRHYQKHQIPVSVGLGAGDPAVWKSVAEVSAQTEPNHINQIFPAAGYTLGRMAGKRKTIVNALIEPSGIPGKVYISTGPDSKKYREPVTCDCAASMLSEIGVHSVKFYPIEGEARLDEVSSMAKAAVTAGITIFEPTGGITVENVYAIVQACIDSGVKVVIPHLYTSLIDPETGRTEVSKMKELLAMQWQ
ncbi:KDGP aldolase [Bacillus sp. 1P06AnD]|uniref:KDGP aldolase n=1 Tax=Bacillus sp. 1P06AnD TaxID=3132208 RepID=UPI0039A1889D